MKTKTVRGLKRVLALAVCGAFCASPAAAMAGSISGTVSAEGGGPIEGIEVCSRANPYSFEDTCGATNVAGAYKLDGLPAGSYYLRFGPPAGSHLNYVAESYDGKQVFLGSGDQLALGAGQDLSGIDAELEVGGTIKGTATDAGSFAPAAGVWACVEANPPVQFGLCLRTGPGGEYEVNGLPTGEYTVSFDGENSANYLRRFYDDAETFAGATPVPVTAGLTVSGIDAALHPGAQMFGRVTEAGTGAPAAGIEVCLFDYLHAPSTEYLDRCAETDAVGNYAMRSLREGTFKVTFLQRPWSGIFDKLFLQQWWNGVPAASEATPIAFAPPHSVTGVDAQLTNVKPKPEPRPAPIQVTLIPTPQPPPKKCRKGFHKKKVKGKTRCVRRHKPRRGKHRPGSGAVSALGR